MMSLISAFINLISKFGKPIIDKFYPAKLLICFQYFQKINPIDFRIYRGAYNIEFLLPYFNFKLIEGKITDRIDNCKFSIDVENNNYTILKDFQLLSNHNIEFLPLMIHYNISGYNRDADGVLIFETKISTIVLHLDLNKEIVLNEDNNFILYLDNQERKYKFNLNIKVNYIFDFPKCEGFIITEYETTYNPFKYYHETLNEIIKFNITELK